MRTGHLGAALAVAAGLPIAALSQVVPGPATSVSGRINYTPSGAWFGNDTLFFVPFNGRFNGAPWAAYPTLGPAAVSSIGVYPFGVTRVLPDYRLGQVNVTTFGGRTRYNWQPYPWTPSYVITEAEAAAWNESVALGEQAQQQAMLERFWSSAALRITPSNARVSVDGHNLGAATRFASTKALMRIPPGAYRFTAELPGYQTFSTVVNLQPGEHYVLARKLQRVEAQPKSAIGKVTNTVTRKRK